MMREETRFDALTRGLARGLSRRGVLAAILGLTAARAIAPEPALAVKDRKRKGKAAARDDVDQGPPPGTQVGGVWDASIDVCHFDFETGDYEIITVSAPALPDYLNAGDTLFIDCCVTSDCRARQCGTISGCIEGACMYDTTGGVPCTLEDGTSGVCGKNGVCQPSTPPAAAPLTEETAPAL